MAMLDGVWDVRRESGVLPPMVGVRKRIQGNTGKTTVGPVAAGFVVDGLELRYRFPFSGFVDVLVPAGDDFHGRALFRGREYGRFTLRRLAHADEGGGGGLHG